MKRSLTPSFMRRHPLIRFLALNLALGLVVAAVAVGGLIGFDLFGLRRLILADHSPVAALALFAGGFMVTFASTVMGSAIMGLGIRPPGDRGAAAAPTDAATVALAQVHRHR
jgi:hypothetical protein